ncbi:MAG: threonine synthase [Rhodothermia bacterium]|nr:MAG: threonine synthase [Rhodothermia bacterium]
MPSFVSHLEGAIDGATLEPRTVQTLHEDRPIWVRYDLDAIRRAVRKEEFASRAPTMWRYHELLPIENECDIVTLGEGMTPLLETPRLGASFGLNDLWIKDESQLPTGSFKARGLCAAVSMAAAFGHKRIAIPTAGNAGGALAAYAARAGMESFIFMPKDTPKVNQFEAVSFGANVYLVEGVITDCGKIVSQGTDTAGWFDVSTLKEPYRIEGKKTMGLEIAEQFDWRLPDVIIYPTGGGTGLIGMWKAFNELRELGWLNADKMPRMVSVQSSGCCPVVKAFDAGERFCTFFENAETVAKGLRVPAAIGDFMILDAIRESEGTAIAVEEESIPIWMRTGASLTGISICPETAACIGAIELLSENGWIRRDESVVIFNCGALQKNVDLFNEQLPIIEAGAKIEWTPQARMVKEMP